MRVCVNNTARIKLNSMLSNIATSPYVPSPFISQWWRQWSRHYHIILQRWYSCWLHLAAPRFRVTHISLLIACCVDRVKLAIIELQPYYILVVFLGVYFQWPYIFAFDRLTYHFILEMKVNQLSLLSCNMHWVRGQLTCPRVYLSEFVTIFSLNTW